MSTATPIRVRASDAGFSPQEAEAIMAPYYLSGERLMKIAVAAHFVLALGLAFVYETWLVTLIVAPSAVAILYLSSRVAPGSFFTRCMAGVSIQVFDMLHIYQLHGLPEMHFFFFTSFALMIACYDWKAMWPGTLLIIAQHILFAVMTNSGVNMYFFPETYVETSKLAFHFGIGCFHVVICGYWANHLRWIILTQTRSKPNSQLQQTGHANDGLQELKAPPA